MSYRLSQARRRGVLAAAMAALLSTPAARAEPRFEGYEIRVIHPRPYVKAGHFELTAGLATIVNQTFIYSFLATGLATYHFSETLAVEAQGGYATSVDREDKRILVDDFAIRTIVLRPAWIGNGRFVWTPSYGKFNLTASSIVYFDTDVTLGFGQTGMSYNYDYCDAPEAARTVAYPTYVAGLSQRYFQASASAFRIGLEDQRSLVAPGDAACLGQTGGDGPAVAHDNLLLYLGWSYQL